jgi:hypothetical protein
MQNCPNTLKVKTNSCDTFFSYQSIYDAIRENFYGTTALLNIRSKLYSYHTFVSVSLCDQILKSNHLSIYKTNVK